MGAIGSLQIVWMHSGLASVRNQQERSSKSQMPWYRSGAEGWMGDAAAGYEELAEISTSLDAGRRRIERWIVG